MPDITSQSPTLDNKNNMSGFQAAFAFARRFHQGQTRKNSAKTPHHLHRHRGIIGINGRLDAEFDHLMSCTITHTLSSGESETFVALTDQDPERLEAYYRSL